MRASHRTAILATGCTAILCTLAALKGSISAQSVRETVIRGGTIVNADGRRVADVKIRDGVIAEIGANLSAAAGAQEIDARGQFLVPGGIDPHVHVSNLENYTTASAAALAGGITTISSFVSPGKGESAEALIARHKKLIDEQAIDDFILHYMVPQSGEFNFDPPTLVSLGTTSLKIFMNRPGFEHEPMKHAQLIEAAGKAGVLSMIHCEDGPMLTMTWDRMMGEGRGSLKNFEESRPVVAEEVATQRAVAISESTGAPVYIVHLSSERALRAAEAGQARGLPVYVETRPVYLHLTNDVYKRPDVGLFIGQPPMHQKSDQDAIWEGLAKGSIQVLATDHGPFPKALKLETTQTVAKHYAGISNLQEMLPMLYSEGVRTKRLTFERFVAVSSTNAAKLFGLYPKKGTIAVGADADIAIWDTNLTKTIRDEDMLSASGYSSYAGWKVTGFPRITMRRGAIAFQDGKVLEKPGTGRLAPRTPFKRPASLK